MANFLWLYIDTHIHASQFPIAGIFGSKTLLEWLTGYVYPMEASYKDINRAKTVYEREVTRTLAQGTTTASYYTTIHVCATNILSDICLAKGQRAFIGRMCMDFEVPEDVRDKSVKQAIADTQSTINHIKKIDPEYSLIKPIITPRFAVSCSSKMMYELGALAIKEKLPIQTHISESQGEVDRVRVLFPYSESYAQVYESHNILRKGTILGHGVHLSNEEVKLIKKLDGKLSHCPVSNSCLGSGIARVKDWLRAQVDVGLGTDVSGGCAIGILEVARHALQVSRLLAERENNRESLKLQVDEVLSLGTLGGAKVVGLEDRIGNFVVGKEWDALLVQEHKDLFDFQTKWEDKLAKWVYCGDEQNNLKVWVRGRLVFERK